ncbi:hypothetical protein A1332_09535 [Methylomonas methanica]|uniref:Glycosyltransferase 2-like domain-containing protein n=1 Tax=Methylomonas methanica TaxID=421 RepID=A0A177MMQ5_METMH|nr:hypothetical protein A1332_09535 [Methylomonas methanica]
MAVVVSYNPDVTGFEALLEALLPQVAYIFVVDNASSADMLRIMDRWANLNVELSQLPENIGIAAAQNVGIEKAINFGADFVLLSDQDSIPYPTMVSGLVFALTSAKTDAIALPVAAVGPAIVDKRTNKTSFFLVERRGIPRRWSPQVGSDELPARIDVGFLIASGTLISTDVIKRIGGMRSSYFIDHVDTEWCFRARAMGYRLLGVPSSRLTHQLGDEVKRVWFFGYRQVMYHSPLRDYYMFRNTLFMLRDTPMSCVWRLHFLWRLMQFAGYFLVFAGERFQRFRHMSLGLWHGLNGQGGRLDKDGKRCRRMPNSILEPNN